MKCRLTDRIILYILLFISALSAVMTFLAEARLVQDIQPITSFLGVNSVLLTLIVCIVSLAVAVFSIYILAISLFDYDSFSSNDEICISGSETGNTYITNDALKTIVQKYCLQYSFVIHADVTVTKVEDKRNILIKIVPQENVQLPELIETLREGAKRTLLEQTGLEISMVDVLVLTPASSSKNKITQNF